MPQLATRARLAHALLMVPLYVAGLLSVVRGLGGYFFPGEKLWDGGAHAFLLLGVDIVVELVLVLGIGLFFLGGIHPRDIGWRFDNPPADLARGVAGFALASLVVLGFALVAGASLADIGHEMTAFSIEQRIFFLGVGLMAAITEESIYRGYLQPALVAPLGLAAGIVVTALIFAAAHLRFSPLAFSGKFTVGLVFGLLRWRDRSLVAPGVAHALIWVFWGMI